MQCIKIADLLLTISDLLLVNNLKAPNLTY